MFSVHERVAACELQLLPDFCSMLSVFQGYYDNPKVCALYVMKGTLEGEP